MRQRRLDHVEVAEDVGLEGTQQLLVGYLSDVIPVVLLRGIVDQNVELAEGLDRLVDDLATECCITDIALQQQAFPAFGLYQFAGFLGITNFLEVGENTVGPSLA